MATKTMTMHQVLAELKTYEQRIAKAAKGNFIATAKGEPTKEETLEAESTIQSAYDSITHLIANKQALEVARTKSNDNTIVVIGGKEYTVSEAIKRKHDIKYDKLLLNELSAQYTTLLNKVNNNNEVVQRQKQDYAIKSFDAVTKNMTPEESATMNKYEKLTELEEKFVKENSLTLLDPLNLKEKIEAKEKEIAAFEIEVDAALSVSNAITSVEVEYLD